MSRGGFSRPPQPFAFDDQVIIAVSASEKNTGKKYFKTKTISFLDWVPDNFDDSQLEYNQTMKKKCFPVGVIPALLSKKLVYSDGGSGAPPPSSNPLNQSMYGTHIVPPPANSGNPEPPKPWAAPVQAPKPAPVVDRVYNTGLPTHDEIVPTLKRMADVLENRDGDELFRLNNFAESIKNSLAKIAANQEEFISIKKQKIELENIKLRHKHAKLPAKGVVPSKSEKALFSSSEEPPSEPDEEPME